MAAPLVLGVASLACQGVIDVARPNCEPTPCLLYTVTVAGSGTRKTTVLNKLLAPVREVEQEMAARAAQLAPDYDAALLSWEVQKKAHLTEIERKAKKNEDVGALREQLAAHMRMRPQPPGAPKFVYEDPTPEAIVDGLCKTWPSAAMISSEGGGFFNGRPSGDLPMWNRLWDGAGLGVERITRGAQTCKDARCGLILAVQEGPFQEFCESRGAQAIDIGFLGRILISRPRQQIGARFLYDNEMKPSWSGLKKFQERVKEMLFSQSQAQNCLIAERTVLEMDSGARQLWIEAYNEIEGLMRPGGEFASIPGYASKIGENAARIAAILHWFEGKNGPIGAAEMSGALSICQWHANEYLNVFGPPIQIPLECRDAAILERWLAEYVWGVGRLDIKKNDVRQAGPNPLRNKVRLDNAIRVLSFENKIRIVLSSNKTRVIQLNPNLFPQIAWMNKVSSSGVPV